MDRKRGLSREALGIFLLAGLLILSLLVSFRMCRRHERIARQLDTAVAFALAEDWDHGAASFAAARQLWEEGWAFSGIVADLSPMEEIDTQFAQLSVWLDAREKTEFASMGKALSRQLRTMSDAHRLSWWNLL